MVMYLGASGVYIPARIVRNDELSRLTGRPSDWFVQVTGIHERRRAQPDENTDSMAIAAVADRQSPCAGALLGVDLIIGASYTAHDTIASHAHRVQRHFGIERAKVMSISSACSSLLNALEVAIAMLTVNRAHRALLVAAEHNSRFACDADDRSGHLWGDAAVALIVCKEPDEDAFEVVDVRTAGLACVGAGPEAINLRPHEGALVMSSGRDVFAQACRSMVEVARGVLLAHALKPADIRLLVPHQANKRILDRVADELEIPPTRLVTPLTHLGNSGCASVGVALHLHRDVLAAGERALLVTFGGGYSVGAALLQRS
jgi:3-oxoacyl-[acyl-carrier-protein] synthase III